MHSINHSIKAPAALLSKIVSSSQAYYQLLQHAPEPGYFEAFVASLPEHLQRYYLRRGYAGSSNSVLFRRFVLEHAGYLMDTYQREHLNGQEYKLWQEQDCYCRELIFKIRLSA